MIIFLLGIAWIIVGLLAFAFACKYADFPWPMSEYEITLMDLFVALAASIAWPFFFLIACVILCLKFMSSIVVFRRNQEKKQ